MKHYISDTPSVTACRKCHAHITDGRHLVSRAFQGTTGRAILYSHVLNTLTINHAATDEEERRVGLRRSMTTGMHTILDAVCVQCGTVLGWFYVEAEEESQKYKEGKWCLERALLVDVPVCVEETAGVACPVIYLGRG
jgi:hypothetical protein